MRSVVARLLLLMMCLLSAPLMACQSDSDCVDENSWEIGIALGLGARSNPLVGGDSIPLVILPDIAWYGESAYFDNGELGYQWHSDAQLAFETYLVVDRERAFFSFWQPSNLFSPVEGFTIDSPIMNDAEAAPPVPSVDIDDIASRDWALNGGVRLHWFFPSSELTLSMETDLSNVHQGQKIILAYQYGWSMDAWRFAVQPRLIWKSDKLTDYYYGLRESDGVDQTQLYQAQGGLQPAITFAANRPINDHWQWLFRFSYQHLHSSMQDSPLVEESNIRSLFVGVGYRF